MNRYVQVKYLHLLEHTDCYRADTQTRPGSVVDPDPESDPKLFAGSGVGSGMNHFGSGSGQPLSVKKILPFAIRERLSSKVNIKEIEGICFFFFRKCKYAGCPALFWSESILRMLYKIG
jgi:hypothetical protein